MPGRVTGSIAGGRQISSSLICTSSKQRALRRRLLRKFNLGGGLLDDHLMMVYGGGVDPLKLKFDCSRCKPTVKITLLEVHPEHLPKRLMIHKPMKIDGKIHWTTARFRG